MGKAIAIVTGASSGMGLEFVKQLDQYIHHIDEIWMLARRSERLTAYAGKLVRCDGKCVPVDLCNSDDLARFEDMLAKEQPDVRILVNGAGVGRAGVFCGITQREAANMVDVNDKALVAVTHMVLPYMSKHSRIIQMCSASAFFPQKEFAVYAASKSFVLRFSKALQRELKDRNISVTVVCPGPVKTEFLEISNKGRNMSPLKKLVMVKPEPVVKKALKDAGEKRFLSIYGIPMKLVYIASLFLPHI